MDKKKTSLISRREVYDQIVEMAKKYREMGQDKLANGMILVIHECIKPMPDIDAIPVEWLEEKRESLFGKALRNVYGDKSSELCASINTVVDMWNEEQRQENSMWKSTV